MKLERAKELAGSILDTAQALFKRDKCLYTVLFSVDKDERITPVSVSLEEQKNINYILDLMKTLSDVSETEAIIVLMDTDYNYFDKGKEVYEDIKDTPGAGTALTVIVHVKSGKSAMRQLIYVKDEDSILFAGEPWFDDNNLGGSLGKNPF
jgi:hypothetical protein